MNFRKLLKWVFVLAAIIAVKQIDGTQNKLERKPEYVSTTRSNS
jgi:hypothetical protein